MKLVGDTEGETANGRAGETDVDLRAGRKHADALLGQAIGGRPMPSTHTLEKNDAIAGWVGGAALGMGAGTGCQWVGLIRRRKR